MTIFTEEDGFTTEEHFEIFKKECDKWINIFGLIGWKILYDHDGEDGKNLGYTSYSIINRNATIVLCKNWKKYNITEYDIKRTAFHEVCELLFARMAIIADTRLIGPDEVAEETHNLIRTLENVVWKPTQE